MSEWTEKQIQDHWLMEVTQRFADLNTKHLAEEAADIARIKSEGRWNLDDMGPRDSHEWEVFVGSVIAFDRNSVRVTLPNKLAIYPDVVVLFDDAETAWSRVWIDAEGDHVVLDVTLVDSWDDSRSSMWRAEHP